MKSKIGLQLYSLKDIINKNNLVQILKKVKSYGYEGVEGVERDGYPDAVHIFCGKKPFEIKSILTDLGLKIISNHIGLKDLKGNFNEIIKFHKDLGCDTLVIAGIPGIYFKNREIIHNTLNELKDLSQKLKENGLELAFHNCPFNFVSPQSYELFAMEVGKELALQPDAGNAQVVRIDPIQYFKKIENPFVSMHIKDGKKGNIKILPLDRGPKGKENETIWKKYNELSTTIGNGMVDLKKFIKLGKDRGVKWFIVEEEITTNPLKTVKSAYDYLYNIGILGDGIK